MQRDPEASIASLRNRADRPSPAAMPGTTNRRRNYLFKIGLLLLIYLILFLREPKCFTQPQFFADDATTFFVQQLLHGPRAIFYTSAQYLHIVPRLLALADAGLPIAWIPLVYAAEANLVAALCCWAFSLEEFRPILRSDALRVVLCLLTAMAFPAQELVGDITNLQWFLTMIAVPLTLLPPGSQRKSIRYLLLALGLGISLSGPLTLVLLPVVLVYALRRRAVTSFQIGLTSGTIIEWVVIARHWAQHSGTHFNDFGAVSKFVFAVFVSFTNQIAMFSVLGRPITKSVYDYAYKGVSLTFLLAVTCSLVALYMRGGREYREKTRVMLWIIFSAIALALFRGMAVVYTDMSSVQPWGAHRYFFAGCWCFAFLILFSIEHFKPAWPAYRQCVLAVAFFALGIYGNFRLTPHDKALWAKYVPEVQDWEAARNTGREHPEVVIPVNPPGWALHLPELDKR